MKIMQLKQEQQMEIMIDGYADLRIIMQEQLGLALINKKMLILVEIQLDKYLME